MKLRALLLGGLWALGCALPGAAQPALPAVGDTPALSDYERKLVAQVPGCTPLGRRNILLLWKPGVPLVFAGESGVKDLPGLADWLESAYGQMSEWAGRNPNDYWEKKTGQRSRLVFAVNGQRGFRSDGEKRPYVGIPLARVSSFDFELMCQAMSLDFLTVPPEVRRHVGDSLEGASQYSMYLLLRAMKMTQLAERVQRSFYDASPEEPVLGRARLLLDWHRRLRLLGPADFWSYIKSEDLGQALFGTSTSLVMPHATMADSLVAAWDFAGAAALADKATAGSVRDDLKLLGDTSIRDGVAVIPMAKGAGLQAPSSADLEITGEITLWARFRVMDIVPQKIISLVDKRSFSPEQRSYAWLLVPSTLATNAWAQGGQISSDGTRATDLVQVTGLPTVPLKTWREAAMVVKRVGKGCEMSWFVANRAPEQGVKYEVANAPLSSKDFKSIFRSKRPLFIGTNAGLDINAAVMEFDEVRLYNRALSTEELLTIKPGELSP